MKHLSYVAVATLLTSSLPGSTMAQESGYWEGHRLFLRACSQCHGSSGRGDGPNASLFLSKPRDLRGGFMDKYTVEALVERVMEGKRLDLALNIPDLQKHARETGELEKHLKRLSTLDWNTVLPGWGLYAERCEVCHGPFGKPSAPLPKGVRTPRDLGSREFQDSVSAEQLINAVRHGSKGMPALIPRLRPEQAQSVAAFVRVLGPGFKTYSLYCSQCHGDDGIGYGNYEDSAGVPTVVFDSAYFSQVGKMHLRESVWHMLRSHKISMPHFRGQLTRKEATAIVRYLKSLPSFAPRTPPAN